MPRIPKGTGFAPRTSAAFRSASRSCPARRAIVRAAASVTHAFSASAGVPETAGSEYWVPLQDDCTTCQGYVADSSVWIRIAPAAPCRAASSYLYVQRP